MRRRRSRLIALALALAACVCSFPSAAAGVATEVRMNASFSPDRLGANAALTLALRFSGGSEGVPAPLRTLALRLPAGLGLQLRGAGACTRARLRRSGAAGCPAKALLGRGRARLEVHAGSQTIPEQASLWAFRAPPGASGAPTFEILGVGSTPLDERTISTGLVRGDSAPFGSQLTITVPPIPTVTLEPNASFDSLSLTLGAGGGTPRAHAPGARIIVPRRCPTAGFPFAVAAVFADGSRARAATAVRCP